MFRMNGMPRAQGCARAACVSLAQHLGKVRPGTGRETGLDHVRYFAIEHKDKVRPGTGRETGLGHVRREAFQFIASL